MPETMTVTGVVDAWVANGNPSYLGGQRLYVRPDTKGYLYFSLPLMPMGANITSATLRLVPGPGTTSTGNITYTLSRINKSFTESQVLSWSDAPAAVSVVGTKSMTMDGLTPLTIDVTTELNSLFAGAEWFGWLLTVNVGGNSLAEGWFHASQSGHPPVIDVEYTIPPRTPSDLSPNQVNIGNPKPILKWLFVGSMNGSPQAGFEVQVSSSPSMTSPSSYAGNTSEQQLDLSTTAFPAMTHNSTRYWRVKAKSDSGEWSSWSPVASVTYKTPVVVSITSPVDSGSTPDPTPTITWTCSGTQVAKQVLIMLDNVVLFDSGIVYNAVMDYTIPVGIIKILSTNYKVAVRVWTDAGMVATPGIPAYVEDINIFQWIPSGATPPVSLLAIPQHPLPNWEIKWEYVGTPPHSFYVSRYRSTDPSNKVFRQVMASEARIGATNWYHIYDNLVPGRALITWSVATRMGNGNTSNYNPEVTEQSRNEMPWVISTDDSSKAFCLVNADIDPGLSEISDVLKPVRGLPVLVSYALQGFMGAVEGEIVNDVTSLYTAQQMKNNLLWLRQYPRVYLVWQDEAIEAFIHSVQYAPLGRSDGRTDYAVSFEFVQATP